jgi:hypothetical protein
MALVGAVAASGTDYDSFDAVTLNDVSTSGGELPYVGGTRDFESTIFDTSTFTLQPGEESPSGGLQACPTSAGVTYVGRTGWVRFNPGSNGRIHVLAETPTYDSVLIVRPASESPWHTATFSQLVSSAACSDQSTGPGDEAVSGVPVTGDRVYYVQVGGRCAGGPDTCQEASTPGGPTRIRVTFTPYDTDADGVPDAQDNCEGQGTVGRVTADGCPDSDLDGINDADDACPQTAGVPAEAPYNGCPAGPRPPEPSNNPFVRIESETGDGYSTTRRRVLLHLNWPQGTVYAVIHNKHSSTRTRTRAVGEAIPWRLSPTKRPAKRGVRVRFRGPHVSDVSVGDSIRFDPTPPEVAASVLLASGSGWYVGVQLTDRGTGISTVTLLDEERQTIEAKEVCDEDECRNEEDLALSTEGRSSPTGELTPGSRAWSSGNRAAT